MGQRDAHRSGCEKFLDHIGQLDAEDARAQGQEAVALTHVRKMRPLPLLEILRFRPGITIEDGHLMTAPCQHQRGGCARRSRSEYYDAGHETAFRIRESDVMLLHPRTRAITVITASSHERIHDRRASRAATWCL